MSKPTPEAPYTPTTENIRNLYVYSLEMYDGSLAVPADVATAEFERWLAIVKAEAAATALDEARDTLHDQSRTMDFALVLDQSIAKYRSGVAS